jgi:hypothetical protein
MQMLYHSDSWVVVRFDVAAPAAADLATAANTANTADPAEAVAPMGFEIVDKRSGKDIFLRGAVAASFQRGARELADRGTDVDGMDAFIAGFAGVAAQPLVMH